MTVVVRMLYLGHTATSDHHKCFYEACGNKGTKYIFTQQCHGDSDSRQKSREMVVSAIQVLEVPFLQECTDGAFETKRWRPSRLRYEVTLDLNQSDGAENTSKGHYRGMAR